MKKYNILVTGCGGDIGQSIGKILKESPLFDKVIGSDINDEHAGRFIYDQLVKLPLSSSMDYFECLQNLIEQLDIDFLLPISESELRKFTEEKIDGHFYSSKLVCANLKSREIGFDKLATSNFLKDSNLPFPKSDVIDSVVDCELPVILKSREGSGSKTIFILNEIEEFNFYKKKYPSFIVQELLADSPDEFTCGLFRSSNNEIRSVIYKRRLVDSYSGYGEVIENASISSLLDKIAIKLSLLGSINIQLKLSTKGPCVFEINPRFSSTVRFRHLMGFEDVIWSIQDRIGQELPAYTPPKVGAKFFKGFNEYII